jgi:hypothetical protein
MSLDVISKEELDFLDTWYTPKALSEILFHDWDNLSSFDENKFGELRLYQESMLSDESLIDFNLTAEEHYKSLSKYDKQKALFQLKKNVGDLYCFGARRFGKTMVTMTMDILIDMMTSSSEKVALASVDLIHIRGVLEPIKTCLQNHSICKLFERKTSASPDYQFELKTGYVLNSVNFNLGAKNTGVQFFAKHVHKLYIEEASLETEEVYEKRIAAVSEFGAIFRISGMTNFIPQSPAGKAYYGAKTHPFVLNYPQYVNPFWDENEKNERIDEYGGKESIGFRMFVEGEVVEDCITTFDMERVRQFSINNNKQLVHIEIPKNRYKFYESLCIVERPVNAERIFISADIGLHVTEINIFSEVNNKYEYLYNLTLNNLTDDEQCNIFKYLTSKVQSNVISLDCGEGCGQAIYNELEKTISNQNLVWYDGSRKVVVGFERNSKNEIILENGRPLEKTQKMAEWSVKHLQDLLYSGKMVIPNDIKFIDQLSQVIGTVRGNCVVYECLAKQGDHLFDSFKVFSIAEWLRGNHSLTPPVKKQWCSGVVV